MTASLHSCYIFLLCHFVFSASLSHNTRSACLLKGIHKQLFKFMYKSCKIIFIFKYLQSLYCFLGKVLAIWLCAHVGISSKTYVSCFKEPTHGSKNAHITMNVHHYNNNTHLSQGTLLKDLPYLLFSSIHSFPDEPKLSAALQSCSYIIYPQVAIRYFSS